MKNKQTAVEWLVEQFEKDGYLGIQRIFQAKSMEKEQMKNFYNEGKNFSNYCHDEEYGGLEYWDTKPLEFEQYYNETYEK